jgi:ABC-type multidrug transport system permease subunit
MTNNREARSMGYVDRIHYKYYSYMSCEEYCAKTGKRFPTAPSVTLSDEVANVTLVSLILSIIVGYAIGFYYFVFSLVGVMASFFICLLLIPVSFFLSALFFTLKNRGD